MRSAGTSYHAGRYLKACDYLTAANEVLGQYRRGGEATTAYPVLEQAQRHRLDALARDGAPGLGNAGALWLKEVAAVMELEEPPGRAKFLRLMERSLEINRDYELAPQKGGGQPADLGTLRPHDERWMSRLISVTELKEAEALAVAMRGTTEEDFRNCETRAREMRERLELATLVRTAGGQGDLPQGRDLTRVEERELDNHRSYVAQQLAAPRPEWSRTQVDWIKDVGHGAPPSMQQSLTRSLAQAELRLEQEQRSKDIELLGAHLQTAAQFFARSLHRSEGAASLTDPRRFAGHVEALTERYLQVVEDGGRRPEQLGLDRARLGVHARGELLAEMTRLDREERDLTELARLEARVILANALRDASTSERERFDNHAFFYRWRYHTTEGVEDMSLAGARAVIGEWFDASGIPISPEHALPGGAGQTAGLDPARMLVATDAEPHLVTAINELHTRLLASEQMRAEEADVINHEYAEMSARRAGNSRGPIFVAEKLLRLEECASVTRNVQMVEVISRSEEALYGAEYAARRSFGRTIAASLAEQRERALDGQYEEPLRLESYPRLAPPIHEQLSERLERHRTAREWERDSSATYHAAWRARSEEQVGELSHAGRTVPPRPLLSHREAEDVYASLSASQRAAFDRILRNVEVMDKHGPGLESPGAERRYPTIHECNAGNFGGQAYLRHEYVRRLGDEVPVISHEQAKRQINRSQSREGQGRSRTRMPDR